MKLYHGSYTKIEEIDLTKAKPFKDFGKGFYATKLYKQAEVWATRFKNERATEGYIIEFDFNEYAYEDQDISVLKFEYYSEEWFDFVIQNRQNIINIHNYDIIEGPVADDRIQTRIDEYLSGAISRQDFFNDLKWHKETHQICFCTVASLVFLQKTSDRKIIFSLLHISEPVIENLIIDFSFDEETATEQFFTSQTFVKLTDISTKLYLKDWKEIYKMLLTELDLK